MKTKKLVRCALIAAVYAALCLILQPISYGLLNVRLAEMLTLLPVFGPGYIWGVTLGCFLANLLGVALGTTVALDIVFGTLATLLGCLFTYALRKLRVFGLTLPAALPPVVCNAVIIGLELSFFFTEGALSWPVLTLNMLNVGIGEIISCCILGVGLVRLIETNPRLHALFIET
ncbi:MAG: QueT transporter family protein [Faecalibacterium sp.]|nr:QueT transporter family protein [Faecalibacterium sp.]